tara:strand:- start:3879 stop:4847 length:969 start_codon:yes stop_codon:yes gene_type:complete
MDVINKAIKDAKPKLKESSIKAYTFNLLKLHEKLFGNKDIKNLSFLKNTKKVLDVLQDLKLSSRKTYLASIVVALSTDEEKYKKELKEYRDVMIDHIEKYKLDLEEQQKTETQSANWTTMSTIKKIPRKYKKELIERKILSKNKEDLTNKEKDLLQKWVVSSLYVLDDENPPPRNDFTPMKVISYKEYLDTPDNIKSNNNFLVIQSRNKKFFSLGEYKTSETYGLKKINLGPKLNSVINIYQKFNPGEYLIYNSRGGPMTPNGLTKYLNKVFEPTGKKNISSTMLRHIYISEKLGGPTLKEKKELADKMGHSVSTQEIYKKN